MFKDFLLGVCYFPEHWDARRHESDIARIARAGFKYVRMAEGAWSYFEPEEGKYQFDLFDRVIGFCKKYNVKVIMGTPTYCGPARPSARCHWRTARTRSICRFLCSRRTASPKSSLV